MGNTIISSQDCWLILVCLTVSVPVLGLQCHQCYNNPAPGYTMNTATAWQLAISASSNTPLRNFFKELIGEKGGHCSAHDPTDISPMECNDPQTLCFNATYFNASYSKDRLLLAKGCLTPIPETKDGCWTPPNNQILSATLCTCKGDYCNGEPHGIAAVALALRCQHCHDPTIYIDGDSWQMELPDDSTGETLVRFYEEVFEGFSIASCQQASSTLPGLDCDKQQTMCFAATKGGELVSKGCLTPLSSQTLDCWHPPRNDILNVTLCTCEDMCETGVMPLLDADEDDTGLRTLNAGTNVSNATSAGALALRCQHCQNPSVELDGNSWLLELPDDSPGITLMQFYSEVFGRFTNASCHQASSSLPGVDCVRGQTMCFAATKQGQLVSKGCMTPISNQTLDCWHPPRNDILNVTFCTCQKDLCETGIAPLLDVDEDAPGLRTLNVGTNVSNATSEASRLFPYGLGIVRPSNLIAYVLVWIMSTALWHDALTLRLLSIKHINTYFFQ